ncbi:MAG: DUF3800 domain-containing protein [Erysipelotrichaceae bacterium]|nr:DUF3800 domain-containing protein [Erysipelotrichaceae bacterium]
MVLYVDETENDQLFIVTGLLVTSEESVDLSYKKFKKRIRSIKIKPKMKEKVFNEFKSTILDKEFQKIKVRMLEEIMEIDVKIIYSCYKKDDNCFNQILKEKKYIELLKNIVSYVDDDINVIFDSFNKLDFEKRIIEIISEYPNVINVASRNSFDEPGIQFVDNLCSTIRLSYSNPNNYFYMLVKDEIIRV